MVFEQGGTKGGLMFEPKNFITKVLRLIDAGIARNTDL